MADILVTTNKDVEGTKSADVITLMSGSAEVESGKGNDIVIDASAGGNEVELGQGDDIMKVYVDANLSSENEYEGGKGFDTLILMLNKEMFDEWMATSLVYDFEHKKGEFDFSHYYSMLGVNLQWEAESFEHLVLNRIASAEDDLNIAAVSEDQVNNIVLDVLANDDDSLAEIKEIVAVSGALGHVEISADGKSVLYNPNGQFENLNSGDHAFDTFTYTLKVTDPNSPNIVSYTTATVSVRVDGVTDNNAPVAQDADFVMDDAHPTATPKEFQLVGSIADKVSDADGNLLTVLLDAAPSFGVVDLHSDGTFTYTSDGVNSGPVTFTYKVNDGSLDSNIATVTIDVPIYGTGGNDTILGTTGNDIIYGLGGNDEIRGSSGNDIIYDGNGDNIIFDGPGNDTVFIGSGNNTINAGGGIDQYIFDLSNTAGAINHTTEDLNIIGSATKYVINNIPVDADVIIKESGPFTIQFIVGSDVELTLVFDSFTYSDLQGVSLASLLDNNIVLNFA